MCCQQAAHPSTYCTGAGLTKLGIKCCCDRLPHCFLLSILVIETLHLVKQLENIVYLNLSHFSLSFHWGGIVPYTYQKEILFMSSRKKNLLLNINFPSECKYSHKEFEVKVTFVKTHQNQLTSYVHAVKPVGKGGKSHLRMT